MMSDTGKDIVASSVSNVLNGAFGEGSKKDMATGGERVVGLIGANIAMATAGNYAGEKFGNFICNKLGLNDE